jgi:hypothetical protein
MYHCQKPSSFNNGTQIWLVYEVVLTAEVIKDEQ